MRVNELLALLSEMPANAPVVVKGYEGGVDDVVQIKLVTIRRDVHDEWYYGRHALEEAGEVQAVMIAGPDWRPDR